MNMNVDTHTHTNPHTHITQTNAHTRARAHTHITQILNTKTTGTNKHEYIHIRNTYHNRQQHNAVDGHDRDDAGHAKRAVLSRGLKRCKPNDEKKNQRAAT